MTERHFDDLMTFAQDAGAKMVFGFNIEVRTKNLWDPTEAKRVITYAQSKGYQFFGFELGNEQNYHYTADAQAADFKVLADLLVELYPDASARPKIMGPDIHGFHTGPDQSFVNFLHEFVKECQRIGVPLHGVTHHEYIEVSEYAKTPPPASMLDITATIAEGVNASLAEFGVQIWAGEIGPHNGGSPGCDHTSLRWANFADSFWYLDAMATKAAHGYSVFCRQDFVGIDYGMLDCATYDPLPDYYAGILWSQLMGSNVLKATSSDASFVRAYAHCSAKSSDDLSVLLLNLAPVAINVTLDTTATARTEYLLTGPDGTDGQAVALNGQRLQLSAAGELPTLPGRDGGDPASPLTLPAASILFVELHGAGCARASLDLLVA
jgi:heparanase 1